MARTLTLKIKRDQAGSWAGHPAAWLGQGSAPAQLQGNAVSNFCKE